ncbi:MAG TPA: AAA family ATPase [Candidatus Rubrimentiphilum sp.]|nr:AAA family ATPase [Candidatus Rubrimentiphilum sp.]
MILERLQMRDFRCYAGVVEFQFSNDPKRNTTVIQGTNGAGKTSILQALLFALYGKSAVTTDSPIISNDALRSGDERNPARASVTLEFSDAGKRYKLNREIHGFLVAGKITYVSSQNSVRLTYTTPDGNTEKDPFPDQSIERMLPSPIRTFFFFDGDRIADFTKPGRERDEKISRAVNDVLHIEALSRAASRVSRIAADKNRDLEKSRAPAVGKTASDVQVQEREITRKRERLNDLKDDIQRSETRSDVIDSELAKILETARLSQARKAVESKRERAIIHLQELRRELVASTLKAIPALIGPQIAQASKVLSTYKRHHEIPARIADYFLGDLLKEGVCICGRPLDDGSSARKELEKILASLIPNSIQEVATDLSARLRPLTNGGAELGNAVVHILTAIDDTNHEISRADKEIERIGRDIDEKAIDRAQRLNAERKVLTQELQHLKEQKGKYEHDLELALSTKKLLEDRLKAELQKRHDLRGLREQWTISRACADALQKAKNLLEDRLRESLGTEATDILKNLASTSKKYFFSEVKVDRNFLLRVLDQKGRDVRADLSMGETQVSSLAFMLAMTRLGGQEAPLVVDTPLARLDVSVRANAAHWLPLLTTQLILLVTDAEFGPEVQAELEPRIGSRMVLNPSAAGTAIAKVNNA